MEYALGALVVLIALVFVGWPLLRPPAVPVLTDDAPASPAEQRAEIYRELVELDLDRRLGKVDEADHEAQTTALLARAAELLGEEDATFESLDSEIEREIAEHRRSLHAAGASESEPRS
jgi:hypothetical protein